MPGRYDFKRLFKFIGLKNVKTNSLQEYIIIYLLWRVTEGAGHAGLSCNGICINQLASSHEWVSVLRFDDDFPSLKAIYHLP